MTKRIDLETVRIRMKQNAADITPQMEKAAAVLFAQPDDVALLSMRELATRADLAPSTFLRLARVLGFSGYPQLRNVFVERLRQSANIYSPRAAQLQRHDGESSETALVKKLFTVTIANIEQAFDRNPPQELIRIVALLEQARRIYLLGQRSSYPIVFFFHYVFKLFSPKSVLVEDVGGTFADDLRYIGSDDVLFAISFRPYTRTAIIAADYAASHSCPVVAMTDSEVSPLNLRAAHTIFVDPSTPSFFDSIAAPVTVLAAMLGLLVARGGDTAVANVRISEDQLNKFAAYWGTDGARRRPERRNKSRGVRATERRDGS
jgi:DNA-binding MurR/RpiR family transcriptional regulator